MDNENTSELQPYLQGIYFIKGNLGHKQLSKREQPMFFVSVTEEKKKQTIIEH